MSHRLFIFIYFIFCFFFSLGPHLQHMEVLRPGVDLELHLPAYATATETQNPSLICELHHSSQQRRIPNPLGKAGDRTCGLLDPSQDCSPLSHEGNFLTFRVLKNFIWSLPKGQAQAQAIRKGSLLQWCLEL